MDLRLALQASNMIHAPAACAAIEDGWEVFTSSYSVSLAEIESIYSTRLQHLQTLPGDRASDLAACTRELLHSLGGKQNTTAHWVLLRSGSDHMFQLLIAEDNEVLGCLKVFSQLEPADNADRNSVQSTA